MPLIVQFFIWFFVVPEVLPTTVGDRIKSITPAVQVFVVSVLALGFFTGARICEQVRAGLAALPPGQLQAAQALGSGWPRHSATFCCRNASGASCRR